MKHRIFLGFSIPADIRSVLITIQRELQAHSQGRIAWTTPDAFHVTLVFIGKIDERTLETTKKVVHKVAAAWSRFPIALDQVNAFPNLIHPRVITIHLHDLVSMDLHDAMSKALTAAHILHDQKPWQPHVTVGRVKQFSGSVDIPTVFVPKISWQVTSLDVIESTLTPTGSRYTTLAQFPLL